MGKSISLIPTLHNRLIICLRLPASVLLRGSAPLHLSQTYTFDLPQASEPTSMASTNPDETPEQGNNPEEIRSDVTAAVDELLNKLSNQFAEVSQEMFAKMDQMTNRIEKLERELQQSKGEGAPK